MWRRDDTTRSARAQDPSGYSSSAAADEVPAPTESTPSPPAEQRPAVLGPSVVVKGELLASEDLEVAGRVEGQIEVPEHTVIIAAQAHILAQVMAKTVVVAGAVTGDILATEKISILEGGHVEGDLYSPKVAMAEGAFLRGRIEMQHGKPATDTTRARVAYASA
jgi:cytoskeletal protein CcmA (bactofilin family)